MKLVNEQSTADIQADGRSRGGETTPDWSSAILWSVSDDWSCLAKTREDSVLDMFSGSRLKLINCSNGTGI